MKPVAAERAEFLSRSPLRDLLDILNDADVETRVVGGAVRDALVGRPVGDVDLATTALPGEVTRRAREAGFKVVPTGIEHGTVTVVAAGTPFEVTTLREDVETDGRRALVRFGHDWRADACRRDFTMNALYLDKDGGLHDPTDGYDDLLKGRVRFIGDADQRIAEDRLRILRFFRFHASHGSDGVDPAGLTACIRARDGLRLLSAERVRREFLRLLAASGVLATVEVMGDAGILQIVLGGIGRPLRLCTLHELEAMLHDDPDPVRRLGVLAVEIREDAERLAERLRLSRAEARRLLAMAEAPHALPSPDERLARIDLYRSGAELFADRVRHAAARQARGESALEPWAAVAGLPAQWSPPAFPVDGDDLKDLGAAGRAIGDTLRALEAQWLAADFRIDREALLDRARKMLAAGRA